MAQLLEGARNLGWVLLNSFLRFIFVFINNCVAIPSYCLYCILLQPLRIMDSRYFWLIEGIMFKWMLAMVSLWGWVAGYTGKMLHNKHGMLFFGSKLWLKLGMVMNAEVTVDTNRHYHWFRLVWWNQSIDFNKPFNIT